MADLRTIQKRNNTQRMATRFDDEIEDIEEIGGNEVVAFSNDAPIDTRRRKINYIEEGVDNVAPRAQKRVTRKSSQD